MLRLLSIQNIAIAENVKVNFEPGLNVITGETGAGKSILVDALGLLRGGKGDASLVRTGHKFATVSAVFDMPNGAIELEIVDELGLKSENEIILRRVLSDSGKSKFFVNDFPVSARVFSKIGEELIDISSQFESQKLLQTGQHVVYLDRFSGLERDFSEYKKTRVFFLETLRNLELSIQNKKIAQRQIDLTEFELSQIENAKLNIHEFQKIQEILFMGQKQSSLQKGFGEILNCLRDGSVSSQTLMQFSLKSLERLKKSLPPEKHSQLFFSMQNLSEQLETCIAECEDILQQSEISLEEFEHAKTRVDEYNYLIAKFGNSLDSVFDHEKECKKIVLEKFQFEDEIQNQKKLVLENFSKLKVLEQNLSKKRRDEKVNLSRAICRELEQLAMKGARFEVVLKPVEAGISSPNKDVLEILFSDVNNHTEHSNIFIENIQKFGVHGSESAEFLFSSNLGLPLQPIEKTASGGELSRVMLAIKNVLFRNEEMSFFVFDEIDTGISGSVAMLVGKKLLEFSKKRQALCITHLPQVACFSQAHFVVSKNHSGGTTKTTVVLANPEEKVEQIAKMISGDKVTQQGLAQARELIESASAFNQLVPKNLKNLKNLKKSKELSIND